MGQLVTQERFKELSGSTGIFGGTFDPIQNAHLTIAHRAREHLKLSQIVFLPAYLNPLKAHSAVTPEQRLHMVKLAIDDEKDFLTSDIEVLRSEPSYTWNTIEFIKSQTSIRLYFICGADCLGSLHKWYKIHELLKEIPFCIAARDTELTKEAFHPLEEHFSPSEIEKLKAHMIPGSPVKGSSTEVRDLLRKGEVPEDLLPPKVRDYILENKLYQ